MTPLRQRMTEDMQLRGLAPSTQQVYLRYVEQLAVFTGTSPDLATDEDFRQFFLALHKQRGCSRSTATVAIAAFKFLFEHTLQRPWPRLDLFRPRPTQTLPVILSVDAVWRINFLQAGHSAEHVIERDQQVSEAEHCDGDAC